MLDNEYRVIVIVVEMCDGKEHDRIGEWAIAGFDTLGDAISHGQRVRRAGERIAPRYTDANIKRLGRE